MRKTRLGGASARDFPRTHSCSTAPKPCSTCLDAPAELAVRLRPPPGAPALRAGVRPRRQRAGGATAAAACIYIPEPERCEREQVSRVPSVPLRLPPELMRTTAAASAARTHGWRGSGAGAHARGQHHVARWQAGMVIQAARTARWRGRRGTQCSCAAGRAP